MKTLFVLLIYTSIALSISQVAFAEEKTSPPVCAMLVASKRQDEVRSMGTYDKFQHCSISCLMTRVCGPYEALETGVLKEAYDALGFGDPSLEDLRADFVGVRIGTNLGVRTRADCYRECDRAYPRNLEPQEKF